jgi:hypothetical protein
LGVRAEGASSTSYKITYDAKSTKHEREQTGNIKMAGIVRHRKDHKADFSVVIARDFQDTGGEQSAVIKEARQQVVTLIRTEDLARLVEIAAVRRLGLDRLRNLFETCITPDETRNWIDNLIQEPTEMTPIPLIVQTVYELQEQLPHPVDVSAVFMSLMHKNALSGIKNNSQIRDWIEAVSRLVPEYLSLHDNIISLNTKPDLLLKQLAVNLRDMPTNPHREAMLKSLGCRDVTSDV